MSEQQANSGANNNTAGSGAGNSNVSPGVQNTGNTSVAVNWYDSFDQDLKGYVESKGFKDPASVTQSYRELEKTFGVPKERILKLPEKSDDPAWNEIYGRLGRPEKPEEYKIEGDEKTVKWAQERFHKLGFTRTQAETFVKEWNDLQGNTVKEQQDQFTKQVETQRVELQKEWGQAYEQNIAQAKQAVSTLGLSTETIDALETQMGFSGVMKFIHNLGTKVGEDSFVSTNSTNGFGKLSPAAAQAKIESLKMDSDFIKRLDRGDSSAIEEFNKLNQMIAF